MGYKEHLYHKKKLLTLLFFNYFDLLIINGDYRVMMVLGRKNIQVPLPPLLQAA